MATAVRKKNWFAIWITVAVVVVVVAVTGVVIAMNNAATSSANSSATKPTGAHINTDTGAISFGDGKNTMDTYIDFMCPICNAFEQQYGAGVQTLVSDKTATLNVHPIAILDDRSANTEYSSRAGSAMYAVAVADYAHAYDFLQAMYKNQPQENTAGLTDQQIIGVAKDAGVKMTPDLEKAITSNRYQKYVLAMTPKTPIAPGSQGIGTPTIAINGKTISLSTLPEPAQLANLFK